MVAVLRDPDLFDVVLQVERRVVDPHRVGDEEGREQHALAVARQQVHAGGKLFDHVLAGELAFVDHAAADVHRLVGAFDIEEGGIERGQESVQFRGHLGVSRTGGAHVGRDFAALLAATQQKPRTETCDWQGPPP